MKYLKIFMFILLISFNILFLCLNINNIYTNDKISKIKEIDRYEANIIGDDNLEYEYNSKYEDLGYKEIINGDEKIIKSDIKLDSIGKKIVKYKGKYNLYRIINVVDTTKPVIKLKGKTKITLYVNDKYKEPGYNALDNNIDVTKNVKVKNNLNLKKSGVYKVEYSVEDSSGNKDIKTRTITVKEKLKVNNTVTKNIASEKGKETKKKINLSVGSNNVVNMKFNSNGIYVKGYVKNKANTYTVKVCSDKCSNYKMSANGNYFFGNIDLTNLSNGTYKFYINDTKLVNKLDFMERINRTHIGNKLVTFDYTDNYVSLKVENFKYEYDLLIDAGHGGADKGAIRGNIYEKNINLEQTLYEAKRYKEHGLKVKLIRDDDTYGLMMGSSDYQNIRRRAYAFGYYGVVSKYVYSNHHNSTTNKKYSGWEIILTNQGGKNNYKEVYNIANKFNENYNTLESHLRIYGRNYDTDSLLKKENGEVYNIKNYYAMQRIPYELFNIYTVTYEGCYISNVSDYEWYIKNYKMLSEIKIKEYVESLGVEYIPVGE